MISENAPASSAAVADRPRPAYAPDQNPRPRRIWSRLFVGLVVVALGVTGWIFLPQIRSGVDSLRTRFLAKEQGASGAEHKRGERAGETSPPAPQRPDRAARAVDRSDGDRLGRGSRADRSDPPRTPGDGPSTSPIPSPRSGPCSRGGWTRSMSPLISRSRRETR